jgi:hypothetical protein
LPITFINMNIEPNKTSKVQTPPLFILIYDSSFEIEINKLHPVQNSETIRYLGRGGGGRCPHKTSFKQGFETHFSTLGQNPVYILCCSMIRVLG